jgi:hypothetical protein
MPLDADVGGIGVANHMIVRSGDREYFIRWVLPDPTRGNVACARSHAALLAFVGFDGGKATEITVGGRPAREYSGVVASPTDSRRVVIRDLQIGNDAVVYGVSIPANSAIGVDDRWFLDSVSVHASDPKVFP